MARGYLLDLDGTLIDSEPIHKHTETLTFASFGIDLCLDDLAEFTGTTFPHMVGTVSERHQVSIDGDEFMARHREALCEAVRSRLEVFEDALPFLESLDGEPVAIVTSSVRWYVEAVTKKYPLFASYPLVCFDDVANGKPHPEPFELGAKRLGLPTVQCIAVEDSDNGVRSALDAGCRVVGVQRHGHRFSVTPHMTVDQLNDVTGKFSSI